MGSRPDTELCPLTSATSRQRRSRCSGERDVPLAEGEAMSLLGRRWRLWISPAARRGRQAHKQHMAWIEKQRGFRHEGVHVTVQDTR